MIFKIPQKLSLIIAIPLLLICFACFYTATDNIDISGSDQSGQIDFFLLLGFAFVCAFLIIIVWLLIDIIRRRDLKWKWLIIISYIIIPYFVAPIYLFYSYIPRYRKKNFGYKKKENTEGSIAFAFITLFIFFAILNLDPSQIFGFAGILKNVTSGVLLFIVLWMLFDLARRKDIKWKPLYVIGFISVIFAFWYFCLSYWPRLRNKQLGYQSTANDQTIRKKSPARVFIAVLFYGTGVFSIMGVQNSVLTRDYFNLVVYLLFTVSSFLVGLAINKKYQWLPKAIIGWLISYLLVGIRIGSFGFWQLVCAIYILGIPALLIYRYLKSTKNKIRTETSSRRTWNPAC